MLKKERKVESGERFRWFLMEILVVFAAIILIVTVFLDFVILGRSRSALQQTSSELIAANSRQLELNINSYWVGNGELLYHPDANYAITGNVSLTARYAGIKLSLADDDESATGITDRNYNNYNHSLLDGNWYSIDGHQLSEKPTQPGLYIHMGNKVIIKY